MGRSILQQTIPLPSLCSPQGQLAAKDEALERERATVEAVREGLRLQGEEFRKLLKQALDRWVGGLLWLLWLLWRAFVAPAWAAALSCAS